MTRIVKKPEERRREIIAAAIKLFSEKGYERVTMQDIMKMLNIAKGTIYHYFDSKESLLEAVVEEIVREDLERKKILLQDEGYRRLGVVEKFEALLSTDPISESHSEILRELNSSGMAVIHARQLGKYLIQLAPLFAEVIQEGCEEGVFHTEHPLESAEFLLAGAQFITDIGFYPWSPGQLMRRMQALPGLVEAQLNAPKGSFDFLAGRME